MSRRPLLPVRGAVARRDGRMMPGGRLWAESPVRAPGSTRKMGVLNAEPPVLVDYDNDRIVEGATSLTVDFQYWDPAYLSGFVGISIAQGVGVGFTAPAGWTTLLSGSVGTSSLGYWVGWCRYDGTQTAHTVGVTGVSEGWTYAPAPDVTGVAWLNSWIWASDAIAPTYEYRPVSDGLVVVAGASTYASTTTIPVQQPSSSWLSATNYALSKPTGMEDTATDVIASPSWPVGSTEDVYRGNNLSGYALIHFYGSMGGWTGTPGTCTPFNVIMTDGYSPNRGTGTPVAADWVTLAIGFTG